MIVIPLHKFYMKKLVDVHGSHCWSDQRTESLLSISPSFTVVLCIQNQPSLMEKVRCIDLDRDKDHLTMCSH